MKKGIVIISLLAGIGLTGFALFKILTSKQESDGNIETSSSQTGNPIEAQESQAGQAQGEGPIAAQS
jgi:hypothetical protein